MNFGRGGHVVSGLDGMVSIWRSVQYPSTSCWFDKLDLIGCV